MKKCAFFMFAIITAGFTNANATLTFTIIGQNDVPGNYLSVFFESAQEGFGITGQLKDDNGVLTGINVNFQGTELLDSAAGFAQISADDGNGFEYLKIFMDSPYGFDGIAFSLKSVARQTGNVTFTGLDQYGISTLSNSFAINTSESWFLITSSTPQMLKSLTINADAGVEIKSLKHVELNAINAVPEPTTMLLFGAGLAGLAAVGRRRKNA